MKSKILYTSTLIFSLFFMAFNLHPDSEISSDTKIKSLSLEKVKKFAVRHSTKVKNSVIDLSIAKKKIWETTASGLPQISGKVSYTDQLKIPTTLIPAKFIDPDAEDDTFAEIRFGTQHSASVDLTVNQLIFDGTYIVGLQSAKIYKRISEENLIKSKIEVKSLVTQTYNMIIITKSLLSILNKNYSNLEKLYKETREMNRAGFIEDTDVDQIKLSLSNLANRKKNMNNQLEISYRLLKFQMGMSLDAEISVSETFDSLIERLHKRKIVGNNVFSPENNVDMMIAETAVKTSSMLLKKEQSSFLPSLSAFFTVSGNAMRDEFNFFKKDGGKWYPTVIAGINLKIPIFSSGLRSSRVQQSRLELKKAVNIKKEVKKGLNLNYKRALTGFSNSVNNSLTLMNSVKLSKKIYNKFLSKYKEGISSSMELIQAYNQYLETEINFRNSLLQLSDSKIELMKLLNKI